MSIRGIIEPEKLYQLEAAKRELGWGNHAMRMARRNGLRIQYIGNRAYVLGKDVIEHITTHSRHTKHPDAACAS